jgi:hypothetical protein
MGTSCLVLGLFMAIAPLLAQQQTDYDLVVYGGTAGGVMTAISAAREGLKVVLLEPGTHLGGMATGGLSRTDFGKKEVIGGYPMEFYWRVGRAYELNRFAQGLGWYYEPKIGEQVLRDMVREAGVQILFQHRLRENSGVQKQGVLIVSVTTEDGTVFKSRIFADCSYEGDFMAQTGVSYTWGRESANKYGETLAGVREHTPFHQFLVPVSGIDDGKRLAEISTEEKGLIGSADKKVQAYNFRMILTDDPGNRIPFPKPANYDPQHYELLARLIEAKTKQTGKAPRLCELTLIALIPGHKADFNNNGPFSTDYIGKSWDYPNASYAKRKEIWTDHVNYTKGFFYFLAHDPRVPESLRNETNNWGLPKDEFLDMDHWPHQLYIREARRMTSDFVMTQEDVQMDVTKPDPIGMGSYNSDSHNVQRILKPDGTVENEGDMQVPVKPYQIPYRVIVPKRAEASNLLVPVCFSASHVAYSSLRMEPQYMMLGQAAGVAAALAIRSQRHVQDIDVRQLVSHLMDQGVTMKYNPVSAPPPSILELFKKLTSNASYSPELF